jgi:hypothetical protein
MKCPTPKDPPRTPGLGLRKGPISEVPLQGSWSSSLQFLDSHKARALIRKRTPLGPYSRTMPKAPRGSYGGRRFLMRKVPLFLTRFLIPEAALPLRG